MTEQTHLTKLLPHNRSKNDLTDKFNKLRHNVKPRLNLNQYYRTCKVLTQNIFINSFHEIQNLPVNLL